MNATELKAWILKEVSEFDPRDSEPSEMYAAVVRELKIKTLEAGFAELSVSLPIEDKKYAVSAVGQLRRVLEVLETPAAPPAPVDGATLSVAQAAERLGVSDETLLGYIHSKQLRAVNVGKGLQRGRYRIQESDLLEFMRFRSTKA